MQYIIPEHNLDELRSQLNRLNNRARKVGASRIGFEELGRYQYRKPITNHFHVLTGYETRSFMVVEVTGEAPSFGGWRFVASVMNPSFYPEISAPLIKNPREVTLPAHLRVDTINAGECEHCKHNRRRKNTYILAHEDGRFAQVGSTCIRDFLGHESPEALAKAAEAWFKGVDIFGAAEDEEGFMGGDRIPTLWDLFDFLILTCAAVRIGGYVSKARAREEYGVMSTADAVMFWLSSRREDKPFDVDAQDKDAAAALMEWADEWLKTTENEYKQNLASAYRSGIVSRKTAGFIASLPSARARDKERQAREEIRGKSLHVGKLKERSVMKLTLMAVHTFDGYYGTTFVHKFVDENGNAIVWKGSVRLSDDSGRVIDNGERVTVKATVKAHDEYKGELQTVVSRVAYVETERKAS